MQCQTDLIRKNLHQITNTFQMIDQQPLLYPALAQGYAPAQPQVQAQVYTVEGGQLISHGMRRSATYPVNWPMTPVIVECHNCHQVAATDCDRQLSPLGWLVCCLFCVIFFPLACITCCIDFLNIYTHNCSICKTPLGQRAHGSSTYF